PLAVAARADGHPENAAASVVGGLVVASSVRGAVRAARLPLDPSLAFVVVVPDRPLSTAKARQALPARVSREDAAFNLGRMGLLLVGLADSRLLVREATEDRLHQDYRSPLFPEAPMLLARLMAGGALAACWSGAGPSLLGFSTARDAHAVCEAARAGLAEAGIPGEVLLLRADTAGLVTGDAARLPPLTGEG
ncbi:MAG: homoserine kinase, partial [Acidimicrobiales bacterium]